MAGTLYRPRVKSFWARVRRLLCRHKNYGTDCAAAAAEEDDGGEKSSFLTIRSSLEALLVTDGADDDDVVDATVCRSASRCVKKDGQLIKAAVRLSPGLRQRPAVPRPDCSVTTSSSGGDRDGAAVQYRRFMFGGLRRRLLMGRTWRPMLVAIPE
ncbi:hypothetical protein ABZP36_026483 [Zizania latifolia]